jgi:hypothetical protein
MLKDETVLYSAALADEGAAVSADGVEITVPSPDEIANGLSALSFFVGVLAATNNSAPLSELDLVVGVMSDILDPELVERSLAGDALDHDGSVLSIAQEFKQVCMICMIYMLYTNTVTCQPVCSGLQCRI